MGIVTEFTQFAIDEGPVRAIDALEDIHSSLETLAEIGSKEERQHLAPLFDAISTAIAAILPDARKI